MIEISCNFKNVTMIRQFNAEFVAPIFVGVLYFSPCFCTLLKIFKEHYVFAIDHNTNALIVRLIARVELKRQEQVCPVMTLVNDQ